jgi:hypothetical protein
MDNTNRRNTSQWKVLCWNIKGINWVPKWTAIRSKISESNCDILCIQETKWAHFDQAYLRNVTSQGLFSCNQTLIMDVIKGWNQMGTNSIKFTSNSKIRSELDFSFAFYWPFVKVFNAKVVPNILIYLQKNSHIFLRCLDIFSDILLTSALKRNLFWKKYKIIFLTCWTRQLAQPNPLPPEPLCVALDPPDSDRVMFFPQFPGCLCTPVHDVGIAAVNPTLPLPSALPMLAH